MRRPLTFLTAGMAAVTLALGLAAGDGRAQDGGDRPWLGVYMQQLDERLRDAMGDRDGVLISRVSPNSPAERAGIRRGDLITRIEGRAVRSAEDVTDAVERSRAGERVTVTVMRDGRERDLVATLGERPPDFDGTPRAQVDTDDDDTATPAPRARRAPAAPRAELDHEWVRDLQEELRRELGSGMTMFAGRGRLGVRVETLSGELGEYFAVPGGRGVLVLEVMDDTPAREAGIKAGDVITRVGGRPVGTADELVEALRSETGRVEVEVYRKGQRRTFEPTLRASARPRAMRILRGTGPRAGGRADRVIVRSLDDDDLEALRRELDDLKRELRELKEERR